MADQEIVRTIRLTRDMDFKLRLVAMGRIKGNGARRSVSVQACMVEAIQNWLDARPGELQDAIKKAQQTGSKKVAKYKANQGRAGNGDKGNTVDHT